MFSTRAVATSIVVLAIGVYYIRKWTQAPPCRISTARIDDKVVIVTGANRGLGRETAKNLLTRGGRVYMACRSLELGEAAKDDILQETGADQSKISVLQLDLASLQSIRSFAQHFATIEDHLDILINNAHAGMNSFTQTNTTVDGLEQSFAVNHLGHFLLTNLLLEHLLAAPSARVVTVASMLHNYAIDWNDLMHENDKSFFKGFWAYIQSKLANILFTKELARRLEGTTVTTYAVHPGLVMWPLGKTYPEGAQTQVYCAVDDKVAKDSGKLYSNCAEATPKEAAQSSEDAQRLWRISVELVQLQDNELHPLARVTTS